MLTEACSEAITLFCSCVFRVFSHFKVDIIEQYDCELSVPSEQRVRSLVVMTTKDGEVFT